MELIATSGAGKIYKVDGYFFAVVVDAEKKEIVAINFFSSVVDAYNALMMVVDCAFEKFSLDFTGEKARENQEKMLAIDFSMEEILKTYFEKNKDIISLMKSYENDFPTNARQLH